MIDKEIKEVIEGNSSAFESIIKRYENQIYKYCFFLLGNKQEAEDAVQETFIKAFFQLHTFRYDKSFSGWLYTIALNHCRTMLRKRANWKEVLLNLARWPMEHESSAEKEYLLQKSCLVEDYKMLSEIEKTILILHTVERYTFVEISNILNIRTSTVRKKFERLKNKINTKENQIVGGQLNERKIKI
ncbi:RNA polymerase sigma factor [Paenibacillus sp. GCM10028914]|uniref:RNA polymerase sigma factor n=1 Tax=Paenibacillus sp. GCM10028914 TaxID=3273416 RepID=UPI00361CC2B5